VIKRVCRQLGIDKWPYKGNKIDLRKRGLGPAARKDFLDSPPSSVSPSGPPPARNKSALPINKRTEHRAPAHRPTASPSVRSTSDSDTGFGHSSGSAFEHRSSPPTDRTFGEGLQREARDRRVMPGIVRQERVAQHPAVVRRFESSEIKREHLPEGAGARMSALYADLRSQVMENQSNDFQMQMMVARSRAAHERSLPATMPPNDFEDELEDGCDLAWLVSAGQAGDPGRRDFMQLNDHDIFAPLHHNSQFLNGPGHLAF